MSTAYGPVLVVAAHPDDEALGCGGTMARLSDEGRAVHVLLVADGETSRVQKGQEGGVQGATWRRNCAAHEANAILGTASIQILNLPDNRLDSVDQLDLVKEIESIVARIRPSTVLTHHAGDVNIDHRIVHDAVVAACRPLPGHSTRELLFFEVPSSSEWRPPGSAVTFAPNWFIEISATLGRKLDALRVYASELRDYPHPRSLRSVEVLARWRGTSVSVDAAEAFVLGRRIV